ncbi:hypothetical protein ACQ4PT_042623 [Festuca glaucescens]
MEAMEAQYPKLLLYGLLILGSWLISCLLHFQFLRIYLMSANPNSGAALHVVLPLSVPIALNASFLPTAPSPVGPDQDGALPPAPSSASCEGSYVHMLDVPSRFDVLGGCAEGSPAFQDEGSMCSLMVNAGMGPELPPATGNGSDGDTGVIPNTGWYNTNQYALEVIVHNRMRLYECLTDDPAAATAVYVPYYPGLELQQHLCDRNFTVRNERRREVRQDFLDHPESANMTVLTYESNAWEPLDFAVPYPSYFHPTSAGEVAAWQERARAAERPWLFTFAGARRANGTLVIRDRIIDSCASSSRCRHVDCSQGLESSKTCKLPRRVVSALAASRFCLQPNGDSYMRRSSVDSVMAGCIPVFFHEASTFKKQYRWHHPDPDSSESDGEERRYWVLIDPDELLEGKVDIEEVLARHTDEEVAAMREEVIKMIPRFLYEDPRVRFEGDMRDAFDVSFDEVMGRMRRIKTGQDLG